MQDFACKAFVYLFKLTNIKLFCVSGKYFAFAASMPTTTITSVKAQSKAFTVKWKKKSSITGYQIQYSTNSKFKKKDSKTIKKKIKIKI